MAIKKGNAPKTIPAKLTIKGQGETNVLNLTYHNHKSTEFKEFVESLQGKKDPFFPSLAVHIVAEWDTDYSLSIEGMQELEDERPGTLQSIVEGFHKSRQFALEKN